MRFNERELRHSIKVSQAIQQGNLLCQMSGVMVERRAELLNGLLFLFKLSRGGVFCDAEPSEVLVLTSNNFRILTVETQPDSFRIACPGINGSTVFYFKCLTQADAEQWVYNLKKFTYKTLQEEMRSLQQKLIEARTASIVTDYPLIDLS